MSAVFYGLNAWLPDVYVDRGWSEGSAGGLLALLNGISIPCGFAVAWAADHWGRRQRWLTAAATLQLVALLGVIAIPSAGWVWAALLGVALGPLFPLTMTLPLDARSDPAEVAAIAAMMLGVGYTVSAASPFLLGVIRDQASSYTPVLWCIVGVPHSSSWSMDRSGSRRLPISASRSSSPQSIPSPSGMPQPTRAGARRLRRWSVTGPCRSGGATDATNG